MSLTQADIRVVIARASSAAVNARALGLFGDAESVENNCNVFKMRAFSSRSGLFVQTGNGAHWKADQMCDWDALCRSKGAAKWIVAKVLERDAFELWSDLTGTVKLLFTLAIYDDPAGAAAARHRMDALKAVVYCTWMEGGRSRVRYEEETDDDGAPLRCRLPELVLGRVEHDDVIQMLTRPGNSQVVWFDTLEAATQRPIRVYAVNSSTMMTIHQRGNEHIGFTDAFWELAAADGIDMSVNTRKVLGEINSLGVLGRIGVDPRPTGNMYAFPSTAVVHSLEAEIARRAVRPPDGEIDATVLCVFPKAGGGFMVVKNTVPGGAYDRLPRLKQVLHAGVMDWFAGSVHVGRSASVLFFENGVNPADGRAIWVYAVMLSEEPVSMEPGSVAVQLEEFLATAARGGDSVSRDSVTVLRKLKSVKGFEAIGVPDELVPAGITSFTGSVVIPVGHAEVAGACVSEPRFDAVVYYTYSVYGGWYVRVERVTSDVGIRYTRLPRMQNSKHSQALVRLSDSGRNTDIAWFDTMCFGENFRVYVVHGIRPMVLGDGGDELSRVSELWKLVSDNSQYISQGSRELLGQMATLQVLGQVGVPEPVPNTYKPACTSEVHVRGGAGASVLGKRPADFMSTLLVVDRVLKILDQISL